MNTATAPPILAAPQFRPSRPKRVLPLVLGSITLLLALALLAGGGAAVWGLSQRDVSGYFTSGTHQLSTDSYALASESLDVGTNIPDWLDNHLATIRVEASSAQPVFVGIGRTRDVERYLAGVRHAQITKFETKPFSVSYRRRDGNAKPAPPANQGFWRTHATGAGTQRINWPVEEGEWSVVAMNANGSRGVSVDARIGARIPSLRGFAIGLLAAGALALLIGSGLMYLGIRSAAPTVKGSRR